MQFVDKKEDGLALYAIGSTLPWSTLFGFSFLMIYLTFYLIQSSKLKLVGNSLVKLWFLSFMVLLGWYHLFGGMYFLPDPLVGISSAFRLLAYVIMLSLPIVLGVKYYQFAKAYLISLLIYCFVAILWTYYLDPSSVVVFRKLFYPFTMEQVNSPGFYNALAVSSIALVFLGIPAHMRYSIYGASMLLSALGQNRTAVSIILLWVVIDFLYVIRDAAKNGVRLSLKSFLGLVTLGMLAVVMVGSGFQNYAYTLMESRFENEGLESGRFTMLEHSIDVIKSGSFDWGGDTTPQLVDAVYYYHNLVLDSFRVGGLVGLWLGVIFISLSIYLAYTVSRSSLRGGLAIGVSVAVYLTSIPIEGIPFELFAPYYLMALAAYISLDRYRGNIRALPVT